MADASSTQVMPRKLLKEADVIDPVYETIDAALVTAGARVPWSGARQMLVHIKNTEAGTNFVTFLASPSGAGATKGDVVTIPIPATTGEALHVVDASLHTQTSDELWVDFESGMTGSIAFFILP